jgi:hypothetical protein
MEVHPTASALFQALSRQGLMKWAGSPHTAQSLHGRGAESVGALGIHGEA